MDSLLSSDNVYRMVHVTQRDKDNNQIPAIRCFKPSLIDEYKLSVDKEKDNTPEESLARYGATYRHGKTEYKDYKEFEIYILNVGSVKMLSSVVDVYRDPIVNTPPLKGTPNNIAHCLIEISSADENEPETYIQLRNLAKKYSLPINDQVVKDLIIKLKVE